MKALSFRIADRIAREFGYVTIRLANSGNQVTWFFIRLLSLWCIHVRDPLKRRSRGGYG